jgi:hypothetical protein
MGVIRPLRWTSNWVFVSKQIWAICQPHLLLLIWFISSSSFYIANFWLISWLLFYVSCTTDHIHSLILLLRRMVHLFYLMLYIILYNTVDLTSDICHIFIFNPLPSLTLRSACNLNVPCRPKRSKALLLTIKKADFL